MSKADTCLSRTIGSLFVILFVIAAAVALVFFNIDQVISNPDSVKNTFVNQNIPERIPVLVADQMAFNQQACLENPEQCEGENQGLDDKENGAIDYLKILKKQDLQKLLSNLMTAAWSQAQMEGLVDQFWGFMQSSQPALILNLSLSDPKNRLKGIEGQQAIMQLILSQPPCNSEQLAKIGQLAFTQGKTTEEIPICQPPQQILAQLNPVIGSIVKPIAESIPDEINLANSDQAPYAKLRQDYQRFHQAAMLSPFAALGLLLLITIVVVRNLRTLFQWWGSSFLLAGLLGILAAITTKPLLSGYVNNQIAGSLAPEVQQATQAVLASVLNTISTQTMMMAGALAILGLLMAGFGLLLPRRYYPRSSK